MSIYNLKISNIGTSTAVVSLPCASGFGLAGGQCALIEPERVEPRRVPLPVDDGTDNASEQRKHAPALGAAVTPSVEGTTAATTTTTTTAVTTTGEVSDSTPTGLVSEVASRPTSPPAKLSEGPGLVAHEDELDAGTVGRGATGGGARVTGVGVGIFGVIVLAI